MEKNKWIIFDLDDVVYNFRDQWLRCAALEGIEIPHWSEWPSFDDLSYFKLQSEAHMHSVFIKHKAMEMAEAEPEAKEAMDLLKSKGFNIGALSARAWHPQAHEETTASFAHYGLPVDKLIISGLYFDRKSDHLNKFGEIVGFIDDSASHVRDFTSKKVPNTYLRQRNWNVKFRSEFPSVDNLVEFAHKVIKSEQA